MSQERLESYKANQKIQIAKQLNQMGNPFLFKLFLLAKLPMAFLAGIKVKTISEEVCEVTVPYRWLNQNPFSSTYFAVLAMAGEMSTGFFGVMHTIGAKPSIAMLVTNMELKFGKKATGVTTFRSEDGAKVRAAIEESVLTGEGRTVVTKTVGYSENGEVESEFLVTWSFKARVK